MSVSSRILLLILVCLVALTGLSGWMLIDRWQTNLQMRRLMTGCSVIETLTDLVGSLQRERGRSTLLLSSKGTKNAAELSGQRQVTDVKGETFAAAVSRDAVKELGPDVMRQARDAVAALNALGALRAAVSKLEIPPPDAITRYTAIINPILELSSLIARDTNQSDIKNFQFALGAVQAASERAGLMRAVGGSGLAAGAFLPDQLYRLTSLDAEQRDFMKSFDIYAPAAIKRAYQRRSQEPSAREMERLKAIIMATSAGSSVPGMDAEQWFHAATVHVDDLRDLGDQLLRTFMDRAERTLDSAVTEFIIAGIVVIVLAVAIIVFGFMTMRSITRLIEAMADSMRKLAAGDPSIAIPAVDRSDELGDMARALIVFRAAAIEKERLRAETDEERQRVTSLVASGLAKLAARDLSYRMDDRMPAAYANLRSDYNLALDQLERAMRSVTQSATAIEAGSREVATEADGLARRTERQAASMEETSAALDKITATVRTSAQGVSHVREFMTLAKTEAEAGSRVAGRASEAMHDIETSSKQIGQIIRVIEEISHQTNLLALNAAVEAARAGESGRGFGIVATEVRALAKRSATAADQIKTLVAISRADVGKGVALVAETGTVLDRMLSQVADISLVVTRIADDAQHQSSSLHDLNMAMRDIDRAARESNVVIENANAASRALAAETSDLNALIGSFALNAQQVAA